MLLPPQCHFDLETFDTVDTAKILSIGAVFGDENFYVEIDISLYAPDSPFTESESTKEWWASRGGFQPSTDKLMSPYEATTKFHVWLRNQTEQLVDYEVWANAPTFDCAIMRHHFKQFSLKCPWAFWQERDVRTIKSLAKTLNLSVTQPVNPHNALQDASNQRIVTEAVYENLAGHVQVSREQTYTNYKLES